MSTRLSDILTNGGRDGLTAAWTETQAAEEFRPLPRGEYTAHVISGELFTSRQNRTPGYKLTFKVVEGKYAGRQFWHDLWLTGPALPMTKRDLAKLGVTALEQLEHPLPQGIRCKVKLSLRKDDVGGGKAVHADNGKLSAAVAALWERTPAADTAEGGDDDE